MAHLTEKLLYYAATGWLRGTRGPTLKLQLMDDHLCG